MLGLINCQTGEIPKYISLLLESTLSPRVPDIKVFTKIDKYDCNNIIAI